MKYLDIITYLLLFLLCSCNLNQDLKVKIEKSDFVNLDNCYSRKTINYSDSLLIFFEDYFDNTPIYIETCNKRIYDTISSSYLGLAWAYNLGIREDIKTFKLAIGKSSPFKIALEPSYNFVSINNYNDTLRIKHLRCLPTYE